MPDPNQQPATKQDLIDLRIELKTEIKTELAEFKTEFKAEIKDMVQEIVRDAQTEILRGFERYARGQDIRMRKIEADISNINTSESLRIAILEERVTTLEQKLLGQRPQ